MFLLYRFNNINCQLFFPSLFILVQLLVDNYEQTSYSTILVLVQMDAYSIASWAAVIGRSLSRIDKKLFSGQDTIKEEAV